MQSVYVVGRETGYNVIQSHSTKGYPVAQNLCMNLDIMIIITAVGQSTHSVCVSLEYDNHCVWVSVIKFF